MLKKPSSECGLGYDINSFHVVIFLQPFKLAHFILAEVGTLTALQKTGKTLPITGCAMTQQLLTGKHSFSRPKYGTLKKITPAIAMRGRLWH